MEVLADEVSTHRNINFMNKEKLSEDNLNRLAKALMIRHSIDYTAALDMLGTFSLNLVCSEKLRTSKALQAALLTAVNTGKRAFHGGVHVTMPENVPCLLPWPGKWTLNQIVTSLGAISSGNCPTSNCETLYLGTPPGDATEAYVVYSSGWRGGIASTTVALNFRDGYDFALAGVAAAALGVARCFLRISGLYFGPEVEQQGISLWRPDLDWLSPASDGPEIEFLPKKLWMLGLGHLGQAYLWCFSMLPYIDPREVEFLLQDFDRAVAGNYVSGLLCEHQNIGERKTRICSDWLESRGFLTTIVERRFDQLTKRSLDEPAIACCGFDKAEPRMILENAGFPLIVECGLGADSYRFDRLILHTFPDAVKRPDQIWATTTDVEADPMLVKAFQQKDDCGIVAQTLAKKAISSSFVGAFAGSLVVAEIVKALHGGSRGDRIQIHLRHGDLPKVLFNREDYQLRVSRWGFVEVSRSTRLAA